MLTVEARLVLSPHVLYMFLLQRSMIVFWGNPNDSEWIWILMIYLGWSQPCDFGPATPLESKDLDQLWLAQIPQWISAASLGVKCVFEAWVIYEMAWSWGASFHGGRLFVGISCQQQAYSRNQSDMTRAWNLTTKCWQSSNVFPVVQTLLSEKSMRECLLK